MLADAAREAHSIVLRGFLTATARWMTAQHPRELLDAHNHGIRWATVATYAAPTLPEHIAVELDPGTADAIRLWSELAATEHQRQHLTVALMCRHDVDTRK